MPDISTLQLAASFCCRQWTHANHTWCGSSAVEYGLHPLSCRFGICHLPQHTTVNDVIYRSLQSPGIPTQLEPADPDRGDGNRSDGITLFPYAKGKSVAWDATCIDTFSPSNMICSAIQASVAANAESRKRRSTRPLQTSLSSSSLQSRRSECLATSVTLEAASRRPRTTYGSETGSLSVHRLHTDFGLPDTVL